MPQPVTRNRRLSQALVFYLVLCALGAYILFGTSLSARFVHWSFGERFVLIFAAGAPIAIAYFVAYALLWTALEGLVLLFKSHPLQVIVALAVILAGAGALWRLI